MSHAIETSVQVSIYQYSTVQCSAVVGDRVSTSAVASEPRVNEGAQRAYQCIPVSQVK
jgi:hypothetical protein